MSEQQANRLTKKELLGALAAGAASVYLQTDAEAGIQYTDSTANPVTSDATTTGDTFWDIEVAKYPNLFCPSLIWVLKKSFKHNWSWNSMKLVLLDIFVQISRGIKYVNSMGFV